MSHECDDFFSFANLQGYSRETEIGSTTLCVPNQLKAAIFVVSILGYSGVFYFAFYNLATELSQRWAFGWKVRGSLLYLIQSTAFICMNAIHLSGVESRGRYIIFFIPYTVMIVGGSDKIEVFFETTKKIRRMIVTEEPKKMGVLVVKWFVMFLGFIGPFFTCTLFPMIYYEDKAALNWCYSFLICFFGVIAIVFCFIFLAAHLALLRGCERAVEANHEVLVPMISKLRKSIKIYCASFFVIVLMPLFPLWMHFTATDTDPGLRGLFYFHHCFFEIFLLVLSFFIMWAQTRVTSTGSTKESSDPKNSFLHRDSVSTPSQRKESGPFPSYNIDELNGTTTQEP